ncbi:hypothetical protein BKA21_001482 [Cellulomonas oligotrophica]|uniref:Uncharacterized protein n=1 Tax=Cellulomonas oligotrophica TaxID=931536 RepID=A0A7Y9FF04_9CELL|nr:hypothetical protein [Cellulomonas oligotrophica]GIG31059.1 hypothetical protein Col01nite_02180 [Cellulomonas oligotrophica]
MTDQDPRRPTIVIRTIEGHRQTRRAAMTPSRYQEQVAKLAKKGVSVPTSALPRPVKHSR